MDKFTFAIYLRLFKERKRQKIINILFTRNLNAHQG